MNILSLILPTKMSDRLQYYDNADELANQIRDEIGYYTEMFNATENQDRFRAGYMKIITELEQELASINR